MNATEEKIKVTIKDLKEWLEQQNRKEEAYFRRISEIEKMSDEETIRKSIINQFDYLDIWYENNFVYDMLVKGTSSFRYDLVSNGYYVMYLSNILSEMYPNNPPSPMFDEASWWLSNCIIQKCYKEAETLLNIINKGLTTKYLNGGRDFKMAAWFIIEIFNKCFDNSIDYTKFNYPEDMKVYQMVLNNWNTNDLNLVDSIVSSLCDYHLSQASYGDMSESAGRNDPMFLQFSMTSWFVYAFEILTWLRVREKVGLKNPEKFSHPLMNMPLNQLPVENMHISGNELFDKIVKKLNS